jgi:putative toxin-antitoxin system antitoxin component (TIGR02293 family)
MATAFRNPVIDALGSTQSAGLDPKRLADMLQMTLGEIADLSGVHRTTLSRNPDSPEVQSRLGPIATILSRASDMSGGLARAILWFRHQPVAAFGQNRPVDLVQSGEARVVLAWLDALEDGAYA